MTVILARIARAAFRFVDLVEMDIIDCAIGFCIIFTRSRLMLERRIQRQSALPCLDINIAVILALDIVRRLDKVRFRNNLAAACKRRRVLIPLPSIQMVECIIRLHTFNTRRIDDFLRIVLPFFSCISALIGAR